MPERIFVAVAWPYTNGPRHLGHVAGFGVPSDVFARYHRLKGNDVLMVSGTDEHGTPNLIQADAEGLTPKEAVDKYNRIISEDLRALGLSYDCFTRTTTRNHTTVVQDVFKTLFDKGYLIKKTALGAFQESTGRTLPDRYIEGTCPICGFPSARGDQCDNCGNQLDPEQLINPRSRIDGTRPIFKESEHFYLDLPAFAEPLTRWISRQSHWRPNVRNFSLNYIANLKPRAITRDIDWGVPIPLPGWEDRPDKRMYVWFDAVIGYFSAAVEWAGMVGRPDAWRDWWQDPKSRHFYFMGKDNIVFHTTIRPAIRFGEVPRPRELTAGDKTLVDTVESGFATVGEHLEGARFRAALQELLHLSALVNQYLTEMEPWKLVATDKERAGTVLYVALRSVDALKVMFAPFLPFSSQKLHEYLGYEGTVVGAPERRTVRESDGSTHEVLTGDYTKSVGSWAPPSLPVGQKLRAPEPLFKKLDPAIVGPEELRRMEQNGGK